MANDLSNSLKEKDMYMLAAKHLKEGHILKIDERPESEDATSRASRAGGSLPPQSYDGSLRSSSSPAMPLLASQKSIPNSQQEDARF